MSSTYDDEELPLALVRVASPRSQTEADRALPEWRSDRTAPAPRERDRLRPASAGLLVGLVAGPAGLAVIHGLTPIAGGIARLAQAWAVPPDAAIPLAYLAAALAGALVVAGFATVTRHLRRLVPLMVWALVFFGSLTVLVLAISSSYGRGLGVSMAPAILGASAVFAIAASLQLPLRRRG